jgi:TonB family protein
VIICLLSLKAASAQTTTRVAVLKMGDDSIAKRASAIIERDIARDQRLKLVDQDESAAAARGIGYSGSLNLTTEESRNLGAAIGCDVFIAGDAQTIRRSSIEQPTYFESYASVFIISARTGKLVAWDRPKAAGSNAEAAERELLDAITDRAGFYRAKVAQAVAEWSEIIAASGTNRPVKFEEAPEDDKAAAAVGFRMPQPYRRLKPVYPLSAAVADAEGVVDVAVDIDESGEVANAEVTRWAGFGLDEAALETVRSLHFRPAMRNSKPIPIRVMLRYNFKRPEKSAP